MIVAYGGDGRVRRPRCANDNDGSIMVKALADRFAERMHERVLREFWATNWASGSTTTG